MGDSILSQAEIDALLNGDSEVKDEPTASVSGESDIRPYDPNTQRRVVRERLQALEIINERFARHFRMGLFNLLRRSPEEVIGMWSEALRILDENSLKYYVEELKDELDKEKMRIQEKDAEIAALKAELEAHKAQQTDQKS